MTDAFDTRVVDTVDCDVCPEDFAVEVVEHIDSGSLSALSAAYILLQTDAGGGWGEIRQAIVNDLATHPHDASAILNVATGALKWPQVLVAAKDRTGAPHDSTFSATVEGQYPGGEFVRATAMGASSKLARHRAHVLLLASFAEVDAPTFSDAVPEEPESVPALPSPAPEIPDASNPIAWLYEYAAKNKTKEPRFTFVQGSGRFSCRCAFGQFATDGAGATKQDSKSDAASKMATHFGRVV